MFSSQFIKNHSDNWIMKREHTFLQIAKVLFVLAMVEIILCGAGRIITFGPITPRYLLFAINVFCAVILFVKGEVFIDKRLVVLYVFWVCYLALEIIRGALINPMGDVITHSKSYLFILFTLAAIVVLDDKKIVKTVFFVCDKAAVVLAYLVVALFIALYVNPNLYTSINTVLQSLDMGNVSFVAGWPRVFFKCVPYCGIFFIFRFSRLVLAKENLKYKAIYIVNMLLLLLACIVSFTMGLWLAIAVASICVLIVLPSKIRHRSILVLAIIAVFACIILGNEIFDVILQRLQSNDHSTIIKRQQMQQMFYMWLENPVFGRGFGEKMTFISSVATREMLTVENVFMEYLVCGGIVGLFLFVVYLFNIIRQALKLYKINTGNVYSAIAISVFAGIILMSVLSFFNPFINNPIGLGFLALSAGVSNCCVKQTIHNIETPHRRFIRPSKDSKFLKKENANVSK